MDIPGMFERSEMAENENTPLDQFQAKHGQLSATLLALTKQHRKNVAVKRIEAQELGINLMHCKDLLRTVTNVSHDFESLKDLYSAIPKPDKATTASNKKLEEEFHDFKEELEKTRVGLESDLTNKIQANIIEIERKLGEYESYLGVETKMLRNSGVLRERIGRFQEDIFDELEPKIKELFSFIIGGSLDSQESVPSPEEQAEPKHIRQTSGPDETVVRKKRAQTATVYTYKLKNTENVTSMHYGQRIGDMYHSWQRLEVKTQVYFLALRFRLKEREIVKILLEKAEKWYQDHKDTHDRRLLTKEYERYFINEKIFESFESQLELMQELCGIYAGHKETYQIAVLQSDKMIELYHGYSKKYLDLKQKIDELVPYLKANAFEKMSIDVEDKLQTLDVLLVNLLSTVHSLRQENQGIHMNINERVVEIQNELTAGEILIGQLTEEYSCLSASLINKKQDQFDTLCSSFKHHQNDFKSCREVLMALWIEDTKNIFVDREKFESGRVEIADKSNRQSYQGSEVAFLIKQSDTKQSQDDIWAPSLNLTNMNAAAEILGEMFDADDGEDTVQAEELLAFALDLLEALRTWTEEKNVFLKSSQSDRSADIIEFFKLQNVREELDMKLEEFQSIKSEYNAVLLKRHWSPVADLLDSLTTQLSALEQIVSVQLVFIQDFESYVKESSTHLEERREAIQTIFRNNSDVTEGLVQFKNLSDGLTELERAISKLTRKSFGIKKRFPQIDLSSQSTSLSEQFLEVKKEVTEQLTGAQLGAQQLTQYSDKMTSSKLKLEAIRQRAQVALRTPIKIDGSDINDTHIKEVAGDLDTFKSEFESIPVLQDPPPTLLMIPCVTLTERDSILSDISGIQGDFKTWFKHTLAAKESLALIQSKFCV